MRAALRILEVFGRRGPTSIPADWADRFAGCGHSVQEVTVRRGLIARLTFPFRIIGCLVPFQPQVVHVHHTYPMLMVPIIRIIRPGARIVITFHRIFQNPSWLRRKCLSVIGRMAHYIVANSQATLDSVSFIRNKNVKIIHNGISSDYFDLAAAEKERTGGLRFLTVARLIPEKNLVALVRAIGQLRSEGYSELSLEIVGGGPAKAILEKEIQRLSLDQFVILQGPRDRAEVCTALTEADAFIMTSLTEGFCNAAVEATAAGLPVVSTRRGALPEVLGSSAWYAEGVDSESLAEAIRALIEAAPAERMEKAAAGRARALERFSIEATIEKYLSLFRDLVPERVRT